MVVMGVWNRAVAHWRLVRGSSWRLGWGIADQGMSSLTNFLMMAVVARTQGAASFGAFSLAYVTYGFALNASRALAAEPLMIRFSTSDLPAWRRATAKSTGTALVVGVVLGMCAFVAGFVTPARPEMPFLV